MICGISVSGEIDSRVRYSNSIAEGHYPDNFFNFDMEGNGKNDKLYEHRGFNGSSTITDDGRQPIQYFNNFSEMYNFYIFQSSQNGLTNRSSSIKE